MAKKKVVRKRKSTANLPVPKRADTELVTDNVPVVHQVESVPAWVALGTIAANLVLVAAKNVDAPLDQAGLFTIFAAVNIIAGVVIWAHNRWWNKEVTVTSLEPKERKSLRRITL
jgi:hypothetical protein